MLWRIVYLKEIISPSLTQPRHHMLITGTSNWSGDYFIYTAGVGFVFEHSENAQIKGAQMLREQLRAVFQRDWNSPYTEELDELTLSDLRK